MAEEFNIAEILCSSEGWTGLPSEAIFQFLRNQDHVDDLHHPIPKNYTGCYITNDQQFLEETGQIVYQLPPFFEADESGNFRSFNFSTFAEHEEPEEPFFNTGRWYYQDGSAMRFEIADTASKVAIEIIPNWPERWYDDYDTSQTGIYQPEKGGFAKITVREDGVEIFTDTIITAKKRIYDLAEPGDDGYPNYTDVKSFGVNWSLQVSAGQMTINSTLVDDEGEAAITNFMYSSKQSKVVTFNNTSLSFRPNEVRVFKKAGSIVGSDDEGNPVPSISKSYLWGLGLDTFKYGLASGDFEWPLSMVVKEVCERSGVTEDMISIQQLGDDKVVGCYSTHDDDAFVLVEELSKLYFFDTCNFDGKLNFIKRGSKAETVIPTDDLVEGSDDIDKRERLDSIEVPRVFTFEYYSTDGWLTPDKQSSDRSLDNRAKDEETKETGVLMHHQQAADVTVTWHKVMIEEQKGYFEFEIPDKYIHLTTGDIIRINDVRLRIDEIEIDEGFQKVKALVDRASAYETDAFAFDPSDDTPPPPQNFGQTDFHILDIPILSDQDDQLLLYVAAAGTGRWQGAVIEMSVDGGNNFVGSGSINTASVMGYTTTEMLSYDTPEVPDTFNKVRVNLLDKDMTLENTTFEGMMNKTNLAIIGSELVNFKDAVQISDSVWEISYFLRGRRNTVARRHMAGDRFVLLKRNEIAKIPMEISYLNKNITMRATSVGSTALPVIKSLPFTGRSQIPAAPNYLEAERDGSNVVITWQGNGPIGGGSYTNYGQHFRGFNVYLNDVKVGSNILNEQFTTTDVGGILKIDVAQVNDITKEGPKSTIFLEV